MASQSSIEVVLKARDEASKKLKEMSGHLKTLGLAAGAVAAAVGTASIKMAMDFEKSMGNVSTLIDESTESMADMKNEVLKLSKDLPVPLGDLTSSLYDIRSAGIEAGGAMEVLNNAAKLSVAGLGSSKEATDVLTSAINAFGLDAKKSDKWADVFFKTVKSGKTTISELARGFGQVAPLAAEMGVSFEELMATTAASTVSGMKASVVYTSQKAILSNLLKPTKEMTDLMKKAGIENIKTAISTKGFGNTIRDLTNAAEGNNEMIAKAFGSVEGLNEVLMITGETGKNATAIMDDMKNGSNAMNEAYEKQKETASAYFQVLKNKVNVALVEIGTRLLPYVITAFDFLGNKIEYISNYLGSINWNSYFEILRRVWDDIKKKAEPFVIMFQMWFASLQEAVKPLIPELKELWDKIVELKPEFETLAKILGGIVLAAILGVIAAISGLVTAMVKASDGIIKMVGGLIAIFNNFIEFFVNVFSGNWENAWGNIKGIAQGAWDFFTGMFSAILGALSGFIDGVVAFFYNLYIQLVGKSIIPDMINAIIDWFAVKLPNQTLKAIGIFKDDLIAKFTEIKNNVVNVIEEMVNDTINAISRMVQALANAPSSIGGRIGGGIQGVMRSVGLPTMAEGGIIQKPTVLLAGEAGPEAIVPLNRRSGFGGINVYIQGGTYLSEEAALDIGDSIIERLKNNFRI